jgi:hypothetical protein
MRPIVSRSSTTTNRQFWRLLFVGAIVPAWTIDARTSTGTGSGRSRRMARAVRIASIAPNVSTSAGAISRSPFAVPTAARFPARRVENILR